MVAVAASGPFDLLDRGVRGFGFRVRHAGLDERLGLVPPGVDRVPQLPALSHVRGQDGDTETTTGGGRGAEVLAGEQDPEVFLNTPRGAELVGGIIVGEDLEEPVQGAFAEPVASTKQQEAVGQAGLSLRPRWPSCSRATR